MKVYDGGGDASHVSGGEPEAERRSRPTADMEKRQRAEGGIDLRGDGATGAATRHRPHVATKIARAAAGLVADPNRDFDGVRLAGIKSALTLARAPEADDLLA